MREGGLSLRELFERVRLRVSDMTKGGLVPWSVSRTEAPFVFFERSPDAPASAASASPEQMAAIRARPLRDLAAPDAYAAALARDTLEGYEEFLAAHPDDPMARAGAGHRCGKAQVPHLAVDLCGRHAGCLLVLPAAIPARSAQRRCRRRLALRAFAADPPASFAPIDYDVPPPPTDELPYVDQPALEFADPAYDFAPPPALPVYFLPPPPLDFIVLPAPPLPIELFALPIPAFVPIPVWCHRPAYVARPPESVIYNNIHRAVMHDHATNVMTIRKQNGQIVSSEPRSAHGAMAFGAPLPASLARRAAAIHPPGSLPGSGIHPQASGSAPAIVRQRPSNLPLGAPLPGAGGHPLPQLPGRPAAGSAPSAGTAANVPALQRGRPGTVQSLRPQPANPLQSLDTADIERSTAFAAVAGALRIRVCAYRPPATFASARGAPAIAPAAAGLSCAGSEPDHTVPRLPRKRASRPLPHKRTVPRSHRRRPIGHRPRNRPPLTGHRPRHPQPLSGHRLRHPQPLIGHLRHRRRQHTPQRHGPRP